MAAKGGHAEVLKYLLSKPEQLVSVNERNQNILDIAIEARQEAVALAIVEHKRWERSLISNSTFEDWFYIETSFCLRLVYVVS